MYRVRGITPSSIHFPNRKSPLGLRSVLEHIPAVNMNPKEEKNVPLKKTRPDIGLWGILTSVWISHFGIAIFLVSFHLSYDFAWNPFHETKRLLSINKIVHQEVDTSHELQNMRWKNNITVIGIKKNRTDWGTSLMLTLRKLTHWCLAGPQ